MIITVHDLLVLLTRAEIDPKSEITIRIDDKDFDFEGLLLDDVRVATMETEDQNGNMMSPVEIIALMP